MATFIPYYLPQKLFELRYVYYTINEAFRREAYPIVKSTDNVRTFLCT